ncbi:MAG: hypothetical protein RIS45_1251 [Planctomycetota bacterium]
MNESRDRLMDALLTQHLGEQPPQMELRYVRAFAALDADAGAAARSAVRGRALRVARAALIALFAGTMLLLLPVESSASGVLASAASAEASARGAAGERRYEVEVRFMRPAPGGHRELALRGNWDMRGSESRLELAIDGLPSLVRADSTDGAWERRGNGAVRSLDSRELWPRWIEERDGRIAVERMDVLLHLVQRAYAVAFARAGGESPAELRGAMHLVASRRGRAPGPDEIDLWIDTDRNVVLEARLRWNRAPHDGMPPRAVRDRMPPGRPPEARPPIDEDYRAAPGALPPDPPSELRLRRVEPIHFPAGHFAKPA